MSGFFPDNGGGVSLPPSTTESTDTGFFPTAGVPSMLTEPFSGVLKPSTASIGKVLVENFPTTVAISNLPGTQRVEVASWPSVQRVALDFPSVQAVSLDFPAIQTVNGSISINNLPQVQDVRVVASGGLLTALTMGTAHIGSVSIDGPVMGSVTVTNQPTELRVSNFPSVQPVSGTVAISNPVPAPTSIKVNNDAGSPIPVRIVEGSYQGGGSSTFDGAVTLKAGTAHIGSVALDQPVALQTGTTVGVTSLPSITGTVAISNPTTSVAVTSIPSITGTVSVSNPVSSVSINNGPASPVPVALQGAVNLNGPISLASGSTVAVSSLPAISGTVAISGKVGINDLTPIRVEVVSGTASRPETSFDGSLSAGSEHIGSVTIDSMPPVEIASLPPVTLANPFDGALKLAGAAVSATNRLPVDVTFPATQAVTGSVSITGTPAVTVSGSVTVSNPVTSVSISNLPAVQTVTQSVGVTPTELGGTITTGGAAQVLVVAKADRRGLWIQNNSTEDLYVSDTGVAKISGSFLRIPPGALYEWASHGVPVTQVSIVGPTTGQAFAARAW